LGKGKVGWTVAFRTAKVAWIGRYFRGAKGDGRLSASISILFYPEMLFFWESGVGGFFGEKVNGQKAVYTKGLRRVE
jgi:hypothetical protein